MKVLIAHRSSVLRSRLVRIAIERCSEGEVFEAENYEQLHLLYKREMPQLIFVDVFISGGLVLSEIVELSNRALVVVLLSTRDEFLERKVREKGGYTVCLKSDGLFVMMGKLINSVSIRTREIHTGDHKIHDDLVEIPCLADGN